MVRSTALLLPDTLKNRRVDAELVLFRSVKLLNMAQSDGAISGTFRFAAESDPGTVIKDHHSIVLSPLTAKQAQEAGYL
ncbi:hypothetical protein [Azomonas macrocytogenes]|uniref:Uncharacterized protein n=1 Tax=Azomonas macrocytogenes TaxID=69962 RepID=A0A839T471_AZOMA|nr:hypothetical protein [Azomonas macrocytogenes]MBB3104337.1 hypothetical protein [Azomonas macrocytogenes]